MLGVADRLARCIDDPRCPDLVIHDRLPHEDGCRRYKRLRSDPIFKMAQDALPSRRDLASQSTMCRLDNLPGVRETWVPDAIGLV